MPIKLKTIEVSEGTFQVAAYYEKGPSDLKPIAIYIIAWLLIPLTFLEFNPISFSTLMGIVSILILGLGCLAFMKWFVIFDYLKKHPDRPGEPGGPGGGPPFFPFEKFLWILFLILISVFVYQILLGSNHADLFDKATLWSAVYGTIFGTLSYLKTD